MDGVTVLNEFEITTRVVVDDFNLVALVVTMLISIIVCAVIGYFIENKSSTGLLAGILVGLVVGVLLGMLTGTIFAPDHTETTTRYEVIIDDNVSMNEFLEHYTIIEQRGEIYVVEENNPQ